MIFELSKVIFPSNLLNKFFVKLFFENVQLFWEMSNFFWDNVQLFLGNVQLFLGNVQLFLKMSNWEMSNFFWDNVQLFLGNVQLFLGNVQLFLGNVQLFSAFTAIETLHSLGYSFEKDVTRLRSKYNFSTVKILKSKIKTCRIIMKEKRIRMTWKIIKVS